MLGQRALVARCDLDATEPHDRFLFQYSGEIVSTRAAQGPNRFCGDFAWTLPSNPAVSIDQSFYGNVSRFINDHRLFVEHRLIGTRTVNCRVHQLGTRLGVLLVNPVSAYEEMLTDYGTSYWTNRGYSLDTAHVHEVEDDSD